MPRITRLLAAAAVAGALTLVGPVAAGSAHGAQLYRGPQDPLGPSGLLGSMGPWVNSGPGSYPPADWFYPNGPIISFIPGIGGLTCNAASGCALLCYLPPSGNPSEAVC
jgi:hypothetical protein